MEVPSVSKYHAAYCKTSRLVARIHGDNVKSVSCWLCDANSPGRMRSGSLSLEVAKVKEIMCGICGVWNHPDPVKIDRMIVAMRHRGPDDTGVYTDANVCLGMTRLAVIDLKPTGHQPMSNPEQTLWIIFNGEIYNYREERAHLEKLGYHFASTSDTEVILRLYEQYGDDFLLRLRGMFALAVYDKRGGPGKERLLLARDHLGIKPLLYVENNSQFIFASEIKALLASGLVRREVDPDAVRLLLTFGSIYQPRTILQGVKTLLPGHRLILTNGQLSVERYWALGTGRRSDIGSLPYSEQVKAMRAALCESIRLQMVSDVPLGAFLSGGVDSSITVAMMTALAHHRVKTFSVGFEREGQYIDETQDAQKTATFLGTDHHHVIIHGHDVRDQLLDIASGLDQPTVDGTNSYFVSRAAREHVTVALSGTGGDELFAGYPWYINMVRESQRPASLINDLVAILARQPVFDVLMDTRWNKSLHRARTAAGFLSRYALQYQVYGSLGAVRLLAPEFKHLSHAGRTEALDLQSIDELNNGTVLERVTALCLRGYTNNQLLRDIDAASMAHSLEVRVPYLDPVLADISLSLPDKSKLSPPANVSIPANTYRALGAKRILIDVGRPLLPEGFDLQPKRGFAMPFNEWLHGPLNEVYRDTLSETAVKKRGWFSPAEVSRVRDSFDGYVLDWIQPWLLMMAELWAREVLDKS